MENRKKIIILLIIVALGILGFFIYKKNQTKISNLPASQVDKNGNYINVFVDKVKQLEFEQAIKKTASVDQDLDGLSDSEELKYKTDSNSSDTDGDGLTDKQEVSIFLTDPLKADTDVDTFSDGYEVRHGFNPKGPGKL